MKSQKKDRCGCGKRCLATFFVRGRTMHASNTYSAHTPHASCSIVCMCVDIENAFIIIHRGPFGSRTGHAVRIIHTTNG